MRKQKCLIPKLQSKKWTMYEFFDVVDYHVEYDDDIDDDCLGFEWWKD